MTDTHFTVQLAGSLSIRDAADTLDKVKAALAGADSLTIDCSALTGADLSIVQLLAAAHKTAVAAGKPLHLRAPAGGALDILLRRAGLRGADGLSRTPLPAFWAGAQPSEAA